MSNHVTHLLSAYVSDEIPGHLRGRVSRHLDICSACYAAYIQERDLVHALKSQLPAFGMPANDQLARLLPGILAEAAPKPTTNNPSRLPVFGVALVVSLMLAILVPVLVMPRVNAVSAPDQPAPNMIIATATLSVTDSPRVVVGVQPTAVAVLGEHATEPPALNPSPVPVVLATPRQ